MFLTITVKQLYLYQTKEMGGVPSYTKGCKSFDFLLIQEIQFWNKHLQTTT